MTLKLRISDMMDSIRDDTVDIRISGIASPESIKEATMNKLHTDKIKAKRTRKLSRTLLIAAVVTLALSVGALAVYRLSLRDMELAVAPVGGRNALSMTALRGEAQFAAAEEWESYVEQWYDAGENMAAPGQVYDEYGYYHAFSDEAKAKLDELLDKYGLRMHGMPADVASPDELYSALGKDGFLPEAGDSGERPAYGQYYSDGTFRYNGAARLAGVGDVSYQLYCHTKGTFTRGWTLLADIGGFEEWTYTTADGTEVLLALGDCKSLIAADMENSFVFINIMSGTDNESRENDGATAAFGAPALRKASLEALAKSFDFKTMDGLGGK